MPQAGGAAPQLTMQDYTALDDARILELIGDAAAELATEHPLFSSHPATRGRRGRANRRRFAMDAEQAPGAILAGKRQAPERLPACEVKRHGRIDVDDVLSS